MHESDWTGTAAAVTAVALTIGVWLWPTPDSSHPTTAQAQDQDDLSVLRAEAKRWDGVQVSSAPAVPGLSH